MRTYGRVYDNQGQPTWTVIETSPQGFDDYVWVTTLIQCLLLNLSESPFYANYGIPAQQALVQQVFPDFYVIQTQRQFLPYFASLIVFKVADPDPHYKVNIVTQQGVPIAASIPI